MLGDSRGLERRRGEGGGAGGGEAPVWGGISQSRLPFCRRDARSSSKPTLQATPTSALGCKFGT